MVFSTKKASILGYPHDYGNPHDYVLHVPQVYWFPFLGRQGQLHQLGWGLLMLLHSSADLLPDVDALRCMTDVDATRLSHVGWLSFPQESRVTSCCPAVGAFHRGTIHLIRIFHQNHKALIWGNAVWLWKPPFQFTARHGMVTPLRIGAWGDSRDHDGGKRTGALESVLEIRNTHRNRCIIRKGIVSTIVSWYKLQYIQMYTIYIYFTYMYIYILHMYIYIYIHMYIHSIVPQGNICFLIDILLDSWS